MEKIFHGCTCTMCFSFVADFGFSPGHIVVDLSCHKDFSINKMFSVEEYFAVREPLPDLLPSIRRYVLPLDIADKVSSCVCAHSYRCRALCVLSIGHEK